MLHNDICIKMLLFMRAHQARSTGGILAAC
jgi:hypothetical protein